MTCSLYTHIVIQLCRTNFGFGNLQSGRRTATLLRSTWIFVKSVQHFTINRELRIMTPTKLFAFISLSLSFSCIKPYGIRRIVELSKLMLGTFTSLNKSQFRYWSQIYSGLKYCTLFSSTTAMRDGKSYGNFFCSIAKKWISLIRLNLNTINSIKTNQLLCCLYFLNKNRSNVRMAA